MADYYHDGIISFKNIEDWGMIIKNEAEEKLCQKPLYFLWKTEGSGYGSDSRIGCHFNTAPAL